VRTSELGLVVTPVLDAPMVERLREDLGRELAQRYPDLGWEVTAVCDALVAGPAALPEVFDAARSQLLDRNWDLVVHVSPSFRCGLRVGRSSCTRAGRTARRSSLCRHSGLSRRAGAW
jgi:hypothetical protein